jgi:hypothetical protein
MKNVLTEADVLARIKKQAQGIGLRATAAGLGVSAAYLSGVLKGRRPIGRKLVNALYLREVVTYEVMSIPNSISRVKRIGPEAFRLFE